MGPVGWGWLSQTRPIPRSPDGDNNDKNEGLSQNILCAKVEVIHDGGVQRGTDIAKALALGADGVDNS